MKNKKRTKQQVRGWLPKATSLPSSQTANMFNHLKRLELVRLAYGVILGVLLVTPFGVYHSISEPYITGYLWGYDLPIGYVGLLLGIMVVLYPRVNPLRSLRFSSLMPIIGLFLLLTFIFSPNYYFINLLHGTSFSSFQIDVDFQLGNLAVVGLSILSIALGLASATILGIGNNKRSIGKVETMTLETNLTRGIRGWLPRETSVAYAREASKPRWKLRWKTVALSVLLMTSLVIVAFVGVQAYWRFSNPQADVTASDFEKTVNATSIHVGDTIEVQTFVYWHGYVFPEFNRNIKIADPISENYFVLASGSNLYEAKSYGGAFTLKYTLKVTGGEGASIELPKPTLTLNDVEISLSGTRPALTVSAK